MLPTLISIEATDTIAAARALRSQLEDLAERIHSQPLNDHKLRQLSHVVWTAQTDVDALLYYLEGL